MTAEQRTRIDCLTAVVRIFPNLDPPSVAWHTQPARAPLTVEDSLRLYGVAYQQGDKVLHPDEVTVALNPITGRPQSYIVRDTP